MRLGLGVSLLIHIMAFFLLWWFSRPETKVYHISSVELMSGEDHDQAAQKKRVKKRERPKPESENPLHAKLPKQPKKNKERGEDTVDAREIKAGRRGDPRFRAVATYAQELQNYIETNRYYPRRAMMMEQTGTVKIRLTIARDGRFTRVEILEKSNFEILNQAAEDLVVQLKSFKPLPEIYQGNGQFIVPIRYQIQGRRF